MAETAYCVKCRAKTEIVNAQRVTMKNGRPALKGNCAKCGTGVYKILSTK
jgi:RNase P subunit RPR2